MSVKDESDLRNVLKELCELRCEAELDLLARANDLERAKQVIVDLGKTIGDIEGEVIVKEAALHVGKSVEAVRDDLFVSRQIKTFREPVKNFQDAIEARKKQLGELDLEEIVRNARTLIADLKQRHDDRKTLTFTEKPDPTGKL